MIMISQHPEIRITVLTQTSHKQTNAVIRKYIYKNCIHWGNSYLKIGKTLLWLNGPHFLALSNLFWS